jgi:hypothetical protein
MSQLSILIPKKQLILSNLRIHNPSILSSLNIVIPEFTAPFTNKIFIVIPFYKNILGMGKIVRAFFLEHCNAPSFQKYIQEVQISIAYKQPNNLQRFLRN